MDPTVSTGQQDGLNGNGLQPMPSAPMATAPDSGLGANPASVASGTGTSMPHQVSSPAPGVVQNTGAIQVTPQYVTNLVQILKTKQAQGRNEQNDPDFARIVEILRAIKRQQQQLHQLQGQSPQPQTVANGTGPASSPAGRTDVGGLTPAASDSANSNLVPAAAPNAQASAPVSANGDGTPMTEGTLQQLKVQVQAYKYLAKNAPVPSHIQAAVSLSEPHVDSASENPVADAVVAAAQSVAAPSALSAAGGGNHTSQTVTKMEVDEPATTAATGAVSATPAGTPASGAPAASAMAKTAAAQLTPDTRIAILDPWALLAHANTAHNQRVLVPSILPHGIDPVQLAEERDRRIHARVRNRLQELQSLPSNLADGDAKAKMRTLIELKSLKLLKKQRKMREEVFNGIRRSSILFTGPDRNAFKRVKRHSIREPKLTERLEKQQKLERERKERAKHIAYIHTVIQHGSKLKNYRQRQQERISKIGRSVQALHARLEKEEKERRARIAQERLRALKAGDEEAYLRLIDQAKDTRITHLLKQTDAFLDSLAQAVTSQKESIATTSIDLAPQVMPGGIPTATVDLAPVEVDVGADIDDDAVIVTEDGRKLDYYNIAHRVQEKITVQPTILVGGTLKEYQLRGLEWMVSLYNNRLNGILADESTPFNFFLNDLILIALPFREVGLGKTIQTISLITFLVERKKQAGPYLVIVPLSTITNWTVEFEKWAPSVRTIVFKGPPAQRKGLCAQIRAGGFNVVLTTFEYIIRDRPTLAKVKWLYTIIDEGHRMKNAQSKLSTTLVQYYSSRYRLILTGTPLQNNLPELWALLNFSLPKIFNSLTSFDDWFSAPFADVSGEEKISLTEEETLLVIKRLHKVLRPFLLRRLKKDVESELPDKVERIIKTKLSQLQRKLYDQVMSHGAILGGMQLGNEKRGGIRGLNNTVMQLRKICNHPFVFEEIEDIISPSREVDDNIFRTSGKFELLDRVLPKLIRTGHRVLMFFQMTQVMNIMSDYLNYRGYKHLRLDGSTKAEDRQDYLKVFNAPGSPYMVFLLSTRAGGLGLNLQTADTVVIFDSDWNPHQDLQAQDRAHRIGQTKEVRILRLITEHSIEERILARAQYKLDMDGKVIQAGKFDNKSTAEEREMFLRALLGNEQNDGSKDEDEEELTNEELNELLARSDGEVTLFQQMDTELAAHEAEMGRILGLPGSRERLIQEEELPEVLRRDLGQVLQEQERAASLNDPLVSGITRRSTRKDVVYDDGLTEDQFCLAIEKDQYEEVVEQRRARRSATTAKSRIKGKTSSLGDDLDTAIESDATSGAQESPAPETVSSGGGAAPTPGKRKRGRPRKNEVRAPVNIGDTASPSLDAPASKRMKLGATPGTLPKAVEAAYALMAQVVDAMMACTDPDDEDRARIELFLEKPSRIEYPNYYMEIAQPISLAEINSKIGDRAYAGSDTKSVLEQFLGDVKLMFRNARQFNQEGSYIYNDALVLEEVAVNRSMELVERAEDAEDVYSERSDLTAPPLVAGPPRRRPLQVSSDSETFE